VALTGLVAGTTYYYQILATNANGVSFSSILSFATTSSALAPVNTVAPAITGTATVGSVLTCSQGTWTGTAPITYAYQWRQDGAVIVGQTASTYTILSGDAGHAISCTVTATNASGSINATSASVTPAGGTGTVYFLGDFSDVTVTVPTVNPTLTGQYLYQQGQHNANLSSYPYAVQAKYPMAQLPSGVGGSGSSGQLAGWPYVVRLVSNDSDASPQTPVAPYSYVHPSPNVSSALLTPYLFGGSGGLTEAYIGFAYLFDASLPTVTGTGIFMQIFEVYGLPYGRVTLAGFCVEPIGGVQKLLYQNGSTAGLYPWQVTLTKNAWLKIVLHLKFSTSASTGLAEIWLNGVKQTFNGSGPAGTTGLGTQTLNYATLLDATNEQCAYLDMYRSPGLNVNYAMAWTTGMKVGSSYAVAAP
jgi:hypothetical protein